jgi:hypothetical protein
MNIEATGQYVAEENGVTIGSFNKLDEGYVFISFSGNRNWDVSELQEIIDKLTELNAA